MGGVHRLGLAHEAVSTVATLAGRYDGCRRWGMKMHYSRIVRSCVVVMTVLAFCAGPGAVLADTEDSARNVELRWALGAWDANGDKPSAVTADRQLETGTKLKFLVEPLSPGSVYLILLDSAEEIHVLYRESTTEVPGRTYVPPGQHRFELDNNAGRETFFLVASVEPLTELDQLLAAYAEAEGAEKGEVRDAVVAEIRRLHKAHRKFARPVEKPVMIGGQMRGGSTGSAIDELAVEISAEQFYGKTITIDH